MTEDNKKLCGDMIGIANVYKNSSEVLSIGNELIKFFSQKQNTLHNGKPLEFDHVIISRIILLAIDIEILLKAMSLADNDVQASNTHDWVKLYKSLSAEHQKEIVDNMSAEFQAGFINLLENNKDAFIRWRYTYEASNLTCDWSFINELANVLGGLAPQLAK